ncbi:MAG: preprotein translocase subunit SecD [Sphingomonadales bacterium]|jgi:preprotein translocase subunit SecD|nr:preprotein translocase subunit SecD [Sphingomonadales bacterium]
MLNFPRWKVWGIGLLCALGVLLAVPSLLPPSVGAYLPAWVQRVHVNLGLDLAGGSQLLLEAETGDVARQRLEAMEELMRTEMRRSRVGVGEVSTAGGQLSFLVRDPAQLPTALEWARTQGQSSGIGGIREWDVDNEGNRITLRQTQAGIDRAIDQAMAVAREIIDRRINALGTLEPTIIRQGTSRIVVQVPGLQDPEALKSLIGRTARLEFKLVDTTITQEQLQAGRAPIGSQILPYAEGGQGGRIAVQRRAIITGDQIADASQGFDSTDGRPIVSIRFDSSGSHRFAKVTQDNVNKPFAIILDNVVISAPNIQEPILGGTAQIRGSFTVESANELAISLRSGRLPVELHVIEERTVGPELGADSIRLGIIASIAATLAVIVFMLVTYGRFGVYTTIALILNGLMIIGIMALFNGTLTLPGIAGFVLTIGAAVDANVLINERIREEQRRGRRLHDALEAGYREASTAIFDANVTNVIAAVLMFYFGSGPIRGFALVLMIGIVTSVFTAVNVTRMLVALWVRRARPKELHI